jgi:2-octaprenyl-6-methoxyphenol hydroxylase
MKMHPEVVIVGGGPVGLVLALMLARWGIASEVLDARALDEARADRRLLALSRGTLQLLRPLVTLPTAVTAPISRVHVSSAGEFGRVELGNDDGGQEPLGLTIRYGDLLAPLAAACNSRSELVTISRPSRVAEIRQQPARAVVQLDDGTAREAQIVVNAEGLGAQPPASVPTQFALLSDAVVQGPAPGSAFERFTRDGPLALLPLPDMVESGQAMGIVWCMPPEAAERRAALGDSDFLAELRGAFGTRNGKFVRVGPRSRVPLHQQARESLREHRVVYLGNAAQTLHPVAGQGFNLGVRDCASLTESLARAKVEQRDFVTALAAYDRGRRADRAAILALTRNAPALFSSHAAPIAFGRSLALTALSTFPDLRRQFARLLMFGVRA